MKFSALNVDFDGPSLNFLGSRKPAHEGIKEQYPRKIRYFTLVDQHRWHWKILNFQNKGFLLILAIFSCSAHSKNEMRRNSWR